jgi:poly-beta-1,6-N-acetyl-D-glucosamine synthase
MEQKLLIISPVRNEADHLELVARSFERQTRPPDAWLLVDDHSDDGTFKLARRLAAEIPFISVVQAPEFEPVDPRDRLASAAAPRTFNAGLASVDWKQYTHIAKFDGDMELPPNYLERILGEFAADPRLGMAGGLRTEKVRGHWRLEKVPTEHHVNGALKCYSRPCFEAIGGIQERLGWDTIDEVQARMHGFRTQSFDDLVAIHHRPWASADGTLRGRARYGAAAYILRYPAYWVALRSLKIAASRPEVISGLAFFYGYLRAAVRRTPRVESPGFKRAVRRETRGRVLSMMRLAG